MRWLILLVPLAVAVAIFATVVRDLMRSWRRRAAARELDDHLRQREEDAERLPGGSPDNPIDIETPAVVEPMATAEKCLRCGGDLHLAEHAAERYGGDRLRVAEMTCARCGGGRRVYFRLRSGQLH